MGVAFGTRPQVPFRIIMHPKSVKGDLGGACFKKARGLGTLQLKCEEDLCDTVSNMVFRFTVGRGDRRQGPCRFFTHDFAANALAEACRTVEWNFAESVGQESWTFDIGLEI